MIETNDYPSEVHNGIDVAFILFHFLPVPYDLLDLEWIDILGPATFNMIHTARFCLESFCICLQIKHGIVKKKFTPTRRKILYSYVYIRSTLPQHSVALYLLAAGKHKGRPNKKVSYRTQIARHHSWSDV